MDEQHLHTLHKNIILALRKAEVDLRSDEPVNLDSVIAHLKLFQNYINDQMPQHPSHNLKSLVYDILDDLQVLSNQIAEEIKLTKLKASSARSSQKVMNAYTYGTK